MNDINTLRTALFETLNGLRNKEAPLDLDRAKAINDTAQTIINTAKVEVDFCRVTGQTVSSGFMPQALSKEPVGDQHTATGTKTVTQLPGATVTQHRIR